MGDQGSAREKCCCSRSRLALAITIPVGILIVIIHLIVVQVIHLPWIVVNQLQVLAVLAAPRERRTRVVRRRVEVGHDGRLQKRIDPIFEFLDHPVLLLGLRIEPRGLRCPVAKEMAKTANIMASRASSYVLVV